MDSETRRSAQSILTQLCIGRSICGLHFYAEQPILVLASYDGDPKALFGGPFEAYLNIEAGWDTPTSVPNALKATGAVSGEHPLEELASFACSLRRFPITTVQLGTKVPHLAFRFADGRSMVINGWDSRYEVWSINAGDWSVYALANGEITWGLPHPALK